MSIANQAKEIANNVINSQKSQTFKVNEGNEAGILALIAELKKHKVEAELVSIAGEGQGIYVTPNWDGIISESKTRKTKIKETKGEIFESIKSPLRVLETPDSSAIAKVAWENETLTVHFKSNPGVPYTYPNCPESEFNTICDLHNQGSSVGSYITRHIKKNYSVGSAKLA